MELLKKLLLGAMVLGALTVVGCKEEEDEWNVFEGQSLKSGTPVSINFTNDDSVDVTFARAWVGTRTNHLDADVQIDIDYNTSTMTGSATSGFIFNLKGEGTEEDPYSFCLIGVRVYNNKGQYFASYYTNVLSADISSDNDDFDVNGGANENKAVEYQLSGNSTSAWVALADNSYTYDTATKQFSVYIDVATTASSKSDDGSYTVTFKKSAEDASTNVTSQEFSATTLANATVVAKSGAYSNVNTTLEAFPVQQEKIAVYAMIGKNRTLKCDYTLSDVTRAAIVGGDEPEIIQNAPIF